jgi:hypothetical protein
MTPLPPSTVELRLGKKSRRLAEYLIYPTKFTVFPLQFLEPPTLIARHTASLAPVDLGTANPPAQGLSSAANLRRNRYDSRPLGIILMTMLEHHPNRPLFDFRRILVLIFHDSILSQIEVSGNTGAVHQNSLQFSLKKAIE